MPELDELFPKLPAPAPVQLNTKGDLSFQRMTNIVSGILDLLTTSSSSTATVFPNPFEHSQPTEWDSLLLQCDSQQQPSGDLL